MLPSPPGSPSGSVSKKVGDDIAKDKQWLEGSEDYSDPTSQNRQAQMRWCLASALVIRAADRKRQTASNTVKMSFLLGLPVLPDRWAPMFSSRTLWEHEGEREACLACGCSAGGHPLLTARMTGQWCGGAQLGRAAKEVTHPAEEQTS